MGKVYSTKKAKTKPNYELKAQVLDNGLCALMRKYSLTNWKLSQVEVDFLKNGIVPDSEKLTNLYDLRQRLSDKIDTFSDSEQLESVRVNNASYKRTTRLKDRILNMLNKNECIFLTLTFTNDVLNNTSVETRKKYIQRFLKETCFEYIANIDFGKKKEREHYHAVVIAKNNKVDGSLYSYGSINFERVHLHNDENDFEASSKRLSKYVNKLTNHAIKETVNQNRVIYSRSTKKKNDIDILQDIFGIDINII